MNIIQFSQFGRLENILIVILFLSRVTSCILESLYGIGILELVSPREIFERFLVTCKPPALAITEPTSQEMLRGTGLKMASEG